MPIFHRTVFGLLILLFFSPWVSALTIVAKEEAPYIGNKLPNGGLSVDIVRTALQRAGYKATFAFETWPRAYEGALIGIYDIVGSIWKTPQRENDFAFSAPYLYHQVKFIKKKSSKNITYNNLSDLDGLIIGTLRGYAYGDDFLQSRKFIRLPQNHLLQNLLLLSQDRIDLTVGEVRKIRYELNQYMKNSSNDLEVLQNPLIKRGTHIAVSKQNPKHQEIIAGFNKALQAMKADGSYDQIVKKHDFD